MLKNLYVIYKLEKQQERYKKKLKNQEKIHSKKHKQEQCYKQKNKIETIKEEIPEILTNNERKVIKSLFIIAMSFLFIIYIIPTQAIAFGPTDSTLYNGIDVSNYQGEIDFKKVKADGIEVVYIKASEGTTFIDPYFEQNYTRAKQNGLKVGLYHYVTARTEEEARAEAKFFVARASGKSLDCKLAMDFESFGNLSKSEINRIGLAFMQEVEKLSGKQVILYSNAYTATNIWDGENLNYPLWVAEYGVEEPNVSGTWNTWAGWQYTDQGRVNGIRNYVDRDKFTKEVFLDDTEVVPPIDDDEDNKPSLEKTKKIKIKWGDTLWGLSIKYNTTVSELVRLNNIKNPNLIYAGASLIVPIGNNNSNNDCLHDCGHRIYTVKSGDTLWSISRRYNTSIANIVRLNKIQNPNLIYPGQMFRI